MAAKSTTTAKKRVVKTAAKKAPVKRAASKKALPKKAGAAAGKKRAAKEEEAVVPKLRIRVRAYEHKVLDVSVKQIIDTVHRFDAEIVGPVPLPTEIKKYTVNRSPFVFKDSREQFEMRVHKRLIDILNPSPKVIDSLTNINLPSGVTIDVKMI